MGGCVLRRRDGLHCAREIVNDTVVAHVGAFAGGAGIIVVAGTGSMILAINESGEVVRNDRYHHYAGGARHPSFDSMTRILIGDGGATDEDFVVSVLGYWHAADLDELRQRILDLEIRDSNDVKRCDGLRATASLWAHQGRTAEARGCAARGSRSDPHFGSASVITAQM